MEDRKEKKFREKRDKAMDNFKEFHYQELAARNIQTMFNSVFVFSHRPGCFYVILESTLNVPTK